MQIVCRGVLGTEIAGRRNNAQGGFVGRELLSLFPRDRVVIEVVLKNYGNGKVISREEKTKLEVESCESSDGICLSFHRGAEGSLRKCDYCVGK